MAKSKNYIKPTITQQKIKLSFFLSNVFWHDQFNLLGDVYAQSSGSSGSCTDANGNGTSSDDSGYSSSSNDSYGGDSYGADDYGATGGSSGGCSCECDCECSSEPCDCGCGCAWN